MDGWNAVRTGHFDLVVTDVDMPRMDGIELVTLIKKDPSLKSLPVMIVSYKDREEDRRRGLEAGADYYLTKGSFHDETLLQAVVDLIGEAARMRIGIVNDLPLAAEALRRALALAPEHRGRSGSRTTAPRRWRSARRSTPDLVLMDLIMPGMDGVEATRRIMAEHAVRDPDRDGQRAHRTPRACSRRWATARSTRSTRRRSGPASCRAARAASWRRSTRSRRLIGE